MTDPLYLIIIGLCGGTVLANIAVMLLVIWRMMNRPKRVIPVTRVGADGFADVIEAWTGGGFVFLAKQETATGVYTLWFQQR